MVSFTPLSSKTYRNLSILVWEGEGSLYALREFQEMQLFKVEKTKNLFIHSRFESMFSYFYSAQRHSIPWRTLGNWRQGEFQEKMSLLDLGKYKIEFDTIIQEYIGKAIQEYEVRDALRLMLGNHSIKTHCSYIYCLSFRKNKWIMYVLVSLENPSRSLFTISLISWIILSG